MSSRSNEKNRETQGNRDIGSDTPTPEPETSCLIGPDEDDSQLLERLTKTNSFIICVRRVSLAHRVPGLVLADAYS